MTIDEMIDALPPAKRERVRQHVLATIYAANNPPPDMKDIISLKKVREFKRNGR